MHKTLSSAINLYNNEEYDTAFLILNKLLQSNDLKTVEEAYKYIGLISMKMNYYIEAIDFFKKIIDITNSLENKIISEFNIGVSFYKLENYKEALNYFEKAFKNSNNCEFLVNIGDCYLRLLEYEKAVSCYDKVLELNNKNIFALINKGLCCKFLGDYETALECYDIALKIDERNSDALWNRALVLLSLGDYKVGFKDFEYRFEVSNSQFNIELLSKFPRYKNESLYNKNLLIVPEQGFGDNIQMIRYIPLFKSIGVNIFVLVLKEQKRLFKKIENINIVDFKDKSWQKKIDFYIPALSLPFLFKTELNSIPNKVPYIKVKKRKKSIIKKSGKLSVGFVWQGEKNHQNDINRSIPIEIFKEIFKLENINFYSLQLGEEGNKIFNEFNNVYDCSDMIDNFYDTAQIVNELDLVITIDSAVAHLCGALAKKTWILLPFIADWRWLIDRVDSPWYPTAKLFRVEKEREWKPLIKKVVYELKQLHTQYD